MKLQMKNLLKKVDINFFNLKFLLFIKFFLDNEKNDVAKGKLKNNTNINLNNNDLEKNFVGNSQKNCNEKLPDEQNFDDDVDTEDDEKFRRRKRERSDSFTDNLFDKRQRDQTFVVENKVVTEINLKKKKTTKNVEIVAKNKKIGFNFVMLNILKINFRKKIRIAFYFNFAFG